MTSRVVQLLSHSIEAHDMLVLYASIGVEAVDIGSYINPAHPHDPKRKPLPDSPYYPELQAAVDAFGTDDNLGAAQSHIPDVYLEWLGDDGAIVMHHYLERLIGDWPRIRDWMRGSSGRRVIWRTVGQSVAHNEEMMKPLRDEGLQIVRYSPKERFIPGYLGGDALIRFYKDPDEWCGWTGEDAKVINFTQHLFQRDPYTNWGFWEAATQGLPREAMGPGSEAIGGTGEQSLEEMQANLRRARVYLYTGTQPASYTLGLVEALMTGIPVVSIGPEYMTVFPYGPDLFEGHELCGQIDLNGWQSHEPDEIRGTLEYLLAEPMICEIWSQEGRRTAINLFGKDTIAAQWAEFLR